MDRKVNADHADHDEHKTDRSTDADNRRCDFRSATAVTAGPHLNTDENDANHHEADT